MADKWAQIVSETRWEEDMPVRDSACCWARSDVGRKKEKEDGVGWLGFGSWAGLLATRPRGKGREETWARERRGLPLSFYFPFLYSKAIFKSILKITLIYFLTLVKPLNTINNMPRHVCSNMFLRPVMNFSLMKSISFLCFMSTKIHK